MPIAVLPPPIDLSKETKRGVIDGLKKVVELFHEAGLLDKTVGYATLIHDPSILYGFIQSYRANRAAAAKVVVGKNGKPVENDDDPLICGVNLAQVQQLLVKTCARYVLEQATHEEETVVTETRTVKRFLIFKKTEEFQVKTGGGFDERKVRELAKSMAFDWQLPLLDAYMKLTTPHLLELESDVIHLRTADDIAFVAGIDPADLQKVKQITGDDFTTLLESRPAAIPGIVYWPKDMYAFYRESLGEKAFDFFSRDKEFFMVCASLDKPLAKVYGDSLCYIAAANLEEMQRLNIDKADVLLRGMKHAFGSKAADILAQPDFAKDILRKLVESLLHLSQEKEQMLISAQITCKAIAPQVAQWMAKRVAPTA